MMLRRCAIGLIGLYQKYISPHKGYCCAYRVYSGGYSCSEYAKITIEKEGVISALPLIFKQFDRCAFAAEELQKKEKKKKSDAEALGDCACDIGCTSLDCLSSMPYKKCISKPNHTAADSCDLAGNCHPFH